MDIPKIGSQKFGLRRLFQKIAVAIFVVKQAGNDLSRHPAQKTQNTSINQGFVVGKTSKSRKTIRRDDLWA